MGAQRMPPTLQSTGSPSPSLSNQPSPGDGVPPVAPLVGLLRPGELIHPNAAEQAKADLQPPLSTSRRAVCPQTLRATVPKGDKLQGLGGLGRGFLAIGPQGLLLFPGRLLPLSFL